MPWQGRTAQTKRPCLTTPPGNHLFYPRPPRGGRLSVSSIISGFSHISIHALREEGDPDPSGADSKAPNFYPRPPRGGRPRQGQQVRATTYFYPRPPRGGRLGEHHHTGGSGQFLSTPSARRATLPSSRTYLSESLFLSTPSARRATEGWEDALREALKFLSTPSARRATYRGFGPCTPSEISIHALREEGDDSKPLSLLCASWISIHALREEGDDAATLTLRAQIDFYPRPPRGGRQGIATDAATLTLISIHALREEGDGRTLPCCSVPGISIHALREEGDQWSAAVVGWLRDFYPRPPRGGRPPHPAGRLEGYHFYPRPPRGGRHLGCSQMSIHKYFYPRPPRGGRPAVRLLLWSSFNFYPRPPRGGRPFSFMYHVDTAKDFYPRPPRGGRPE